MKIIVPLAWLAAQVCAIAGLILANPVDEVPAWSKIVGYFIIFVWLLVSTLYMWLSFEPKTPQKQH